jgi:nifR3 family TIM-barrel protein
VPKVVKRGGGAELLRRASHLERMLRAVRREISVPLTLKIRIGWDHESINGVEVSQMAEAAGVALITVHGRTRVQAYTGLADWEQIAAVKQAVEIPVVGSGDVVSVAAARERWEASRVDGIAIARAAMENPWIFAEIADALAGGQRPSPSVADRCAALRRFRDLLSELYPEKVSSARLRGMACRIIKGFPGSAALREAVSHTRSSEDLLATLADFEEATRRTGKSDAVPPPPDAARLATNASAASHLDAA